ncbi:MAG TPA: hypothetical protein VLW25_06600 [Bryobacteraceae bacterium]|nr:hypothetical protein [Bryobacteraceae bacterium]
MRSVAQALERLQQSLDRQGIHYFLAGSLASSIHGVQRSTRDIDIVAAIGEGHTVALAQDLQGEFYIDADAAAEALRHGRSFNLIHFASSYKFDIFPVPDDPYYQAQLRRSEPKSIVLEEGLVVRSFVATAEDTILSKLVWYRLGGESSDQQWSDLRGVRTVQGAGLDQNYLRKWAPHLGVQDLLDRLLSEGL